MKVLTSYVLYPSPDEQINIKRYACFVKHIISVEIDMVMWPNNEARSVQLMRYLLNTATVYRTQGWVYNQIAQVSVYQWLHSTDSIYK